MPSPVFQATKEYNEQSTILYDIARSTIQFEGVMAPFEQTYINTFRVGKYADGNALLQYMHMGYEEGRPAVFCRNANGWVTIPKSIKLPENQQDRDMIARELLVKFQMSPKHPLVDLKKAYLKF